MQRISIVVEALQDLAVRKPGQAYMVLPGRARQPQQTAAAPHRRDRNRKYGNPVVLGFQGRSQLEKRYGQDAEDMLSQPTTKLFYKSSEPRAAK